MKQSTSPANGLTAEYDAGAMRFGGGTGGWKRRLTLLGRALAEPLVALGEVLAIARGMRFRAMSRVLRRRVTIGRNLRIDGKLMPRGPGRLVIGDNVRIGMSVTPWTHSPDALIEIGSDCFLNGTRFGCAQAIRIGSRSIIGQSSIMDTDFHSIRADRHTEDAPVRVAPVVLEENVWVGAQAGILPGTTIGRNSVVGFGAVCAGQYPADVVIAGNPARVVRPLTR